ncbi:MAG: hypothetical protein IKQ71_03960 [Lachnospiraceae bacterium]|nr:hypothetical protein [Lachnospiraceae bacterium]
MKRIKGLLIFISVSLLLTACSSVIDLNDSESEAIAEYCAELLLKYDKAFVTKYSNGELDEVEIKKEADATEDTSPNFTVEPTTETPSSTEAASSTEVTTTKEVSTEAATTTEAVSSSEEQPTSETTSTETTEATDTTEEKSTEKSGDDNKSESPKKMGSEQDIAKIAGIDDVSILFNNHQIVDRYPSQDKDGNFIYLESSEGMKLIVLEFDVVNKKDSETTVDLMNIPLEYRIVMNNQKAAKPMLTILMDDLTTYQATLAPSSKGKAVVVFQIANNLVDQIETLDLRVTYNDVTNVIMVK